MSHFTLTSTAAAAQPVGATLSRRNLWADRLGAWLDHLLEPDVRRLDDHMLKDIGLQREAPGCGAGQLHRTGWGL